MKIEVIENKIIELAKKILPKQVFSFLEKLGMAKICALILILTGLSTVCFALAFQFIGGVKPCILCYYQRVPFYLAGIIGLIIYSDKVSIKIKKTLILISCLTFLFNVGVAIYNIGVEQAIWTGTDQCQGERVSEFSITALENSLKESPQARCDDVLWSLFGKGYVTLAVFNVFGSSFMFFLTFLMVKRKKWLKPKNMS
jgi:disulfide bond formation protein DsbB